MYGAGGTLTAGPLRPGNPGAPELPLSPCRGQYSTLTESDTNSAMAHFVKRWELSGVHYYFFLRPPM